MFYCALLTLPLRLRDKVVTSATECAKRYVITNPPFDFGLLPTDQVSNDWSGG